MTTEKRIVGVLLLSPFVGLIGLGFYANWVATLTLVGVIVGSVAYGIAAAWVLE